MFTMGVPSTLLCIYRDPAQLLHLKESGYRLVTATNGGEGLRLLMSHAVDAVVMEYHHGLLNGVAVASEIKQVKPQIPIVMICDDLELPCDASKSVDAFVVRTDGYHFLVATIHFVLSMDWKHSPATSKHFNRMGLGRSRRTGISHPRRSSTDERNAPFSSRLWASILDGTIRF